MIRVTWIDGRVYRGATPDDAIRVMKHAGVFTAGKTDDEYISGVARRINETYGIVVLHPTAQSLLDTLQTIGLVTIQEEH